ncbi:MAG: acyltransferase family protein [Clostridium sp.]|jgi:peptidoglycan/LPS O-acetylase OafA/YrhL|nr:acyltransferase family protein [Clostridium sp.]
MMQKQFTKNFSFSAKGLAILLLLMYHLFENEALISSMNVIYQPFSLSAFLTLTGFGNVCVSIFVFLTAFGIAKGLLSMESMTPALAYKQAVKRFVILMAHFVVLYLSINLLWWVKFDYQSLYGLNKQGFLYIITDATGLSMFFDTPTLNATWWYMEIAYLLIFLVPLLVWLTKKIGYPILLLAAFTPHIITFNYDVTRYLFVAVFGICAAYGKWTDKMLNLKIHLVFQWIIGIVGFVLCVLIRQNYVVYETYIHLIDAPIALFLIYLATLIGSIPLLGKALAFLGKHSFNIYLVHTFFYMALWQKYVYYFRYSWVTLLVLLISCLIYSILLEFFKKVTGFKKLLARYHG